jgi:hypothetical protein
LTGMVWTPDSMFFTVTSDKAIPPYPV